MNRQRAWRGTAALTAVIALACLYSVAAQQPAPKSARPAARTPTPPGTAAPAAAQPHTTVDDGVRKAEILGSQRWRRAMFEMNEWLSAQRLYTPEQVAKIKTDFRAKVNRMTAGELQFMLDDMDAKFQILETPQAQDARAWLAQYLSILSDKKREEVIGRLPNIGTMTAAQLQQQIAMIEERRAAQSQQQRQVQQLRESAPNPWTQNTKMAEQAYYREHTMQRSAYSSPYRAPSTERPFENVHTGPNMDFYVTPYGGVGLMFNNGF
jgi:hypothetical protein